MTEEAAKAPAKRPGADWERIEAEYRAGVKSLREIAAEHGNGVSHVAIKKRADKLGWARDLEAKVKAKAQAVVNRALVNASVNKVTKATEQEVVEAAAQRQAMVILQHRQDLGRMRGQLTNLLGELEQTTDERDAIEQLRDALAAEDEKRGQKLWDAWHRFASLPARADTFKKLMDSARIVLDKEREAYGVDSKGGGGDDTPTVTTRDLTGKKL